MITKIGQIWPFALEKTNANTQTVQLFISIYRPNISVTAAKRMTMATSHEIDLSADALKDVWLTALIFLGT